MKKSPVKWVRKTAEAAYKQRKVYSSAHAGTVHKFTVARAGENGPTILPVKTKDGQLVQAANGSGLLMKKVWNLKATSEEASLRLNPVLEDAIIAEAEGNHDLAADLYNHYLNGTAISFSILSTSRVYNTDFSNAQISAVLQQVTTENGSFLTIDPQSIRILEAAEGRDSAQFASAYFGRSAADLIAEREEKKKAEMFDVNKVIS